MITEVRFEAFHRLVKWRIRR